MNSQTHRFYISRMMLMFSTLLLGFLTASAVSAMNNADTNRNKVADFDGDGKSDISVFRPSNGFWHIMKSSGGFSSVQWGQRNDFLVPGDYDGDGRTDTAVYRRGTPPPPPANGSADNIWYVLKSSDNTSFARAVGKTSTYMPTDSDTNPAPADYDNDGRTDIAVSLSCGICRSQKLT
ncbi:MAG: VCBS repeat-containing protein [Pyrinomonadaceae bacterium]